MISVSRSPKIAKASLNFIFPCWKSNQGILFSYRTLIHTYSERYSWDNCASGILWVRGLQQELSSSPVLSQARLKLVHSFVGKEIVPHSSELSQQEKEQSNTWHGEVAPSATTGLSHGWYHQTALKIAPKNTSDAEESWKLNEDMRILDPSV